MTDDIATRFTAYFENERPECENVTITDIVRIHGGASRQTYRLRATYIINGRPRTERLILRRDPESSLIETERSTEVGALLAFQDSDVPVPRIDFLETDPKWLDRPFFVMEEIQASAPGRVFQPDPYGPHRQEVGEQFWEILGNIHGTLLSELDLGEGFEEPEEPWLEALTYWEDVINEDELEPNPLVRAAIRWLKNNPPPPPERLTVVHGDYRHGNFLVNDAGDITAILDWEMCHLGDPMEDVGWALDTIWAAPGDHPGGMIPVEEGLAIWSDVSGLEIDPDAMLWWKIFAAVKGMAIWISSAREFADARNMDPVIAFSAWYPAQAHSEVLIELMKQARGRT
ncbi:MAG: phosphotransferase family protein [Sphingomonadales bacterium]|nr:MAG: phosphotransferase family protein [Sphingomonadales bacterium]